MRKRKGKNKNKTLLKIILFCITICIIPFCVFLFINFSILFEQYRTFTREMFWASAGFICFIFIFFIFGAPVKSYVLEHELSHLLFAFLSGTKIKTLSLKRRDAFVETERVNLFIALAPYSVPLYTVLIVLLHKIIVVFTESALINKLFYFLFGITLSFHFVATFHYLQLDQPDVKRYGYFSSLILIITWAIIIISIIFALMFKDIQLLKFYRSSFKEAIGFYKSFGIFLTNVFTRL